MKQLFRNIILLSAACIFSACSTSNYIHNKESYNRQLEIQKMRAESVAGGFVNGSVSLISAAFFDEFISLDFDPQQFKKINLINPTKDTVYVNMLADVLWDSIHYCDFMDIRIPPKENCKLLVPVDTKYNLYFSNTIQNDDDQLMQINTDDVKQVMIKPSDNALSRK